MAGKSKPKNQNQYVSIFAPQISRKKDKILLQEVNSRIVEFYTVYAPARLKDEKNHERLIKYAQKKGYLALERNIKSKYGCVLEEADSSTHGWWRKQKLLSRFYEDYRVETTDKKMKETMYWARRNGLAALDEKLKTSYKESLSEYESRGILTWKQNWNECLNAISTDYFDYQLSRFYSYVGKYRGVQTSKDDVESRVKWAMQHTRVEVNEKLLERYGLCLDDIKMTPGITRLERLTNLTTELTEFFLKYDPLKLRQDPQSIRSLAEKGLIYYEDLNEYLQQTYQADLIESGKEKLMEMLRTFYAARDIVKSEDSLERIVRYATNYGMNALNEKLMLQYGESLDDIPSGEV